MPKYALDTYFDPDPVAEVEPVEATKTQIKNTIKTLLAGGPMTEIDLLNRVALEYPGVRVGVIERCIAALVENGKVKVGESFHREVVGP